MAVSENFAKLALLIKNNAAPDSTKKTQRHGRITMAKNKKVSTLTKSELFYANHYGLKVCATTGDEQKAQRGLEKRLRARIKKEGIESIDEWVMLVKKEESVRKKRAQKAAKEEMQILSQISEDDAYHFFATHFRTGENIGKTTARYGKKNGIEVFERKDPNGYARSCRFTMTRRDFILNIIKGYHLKIIGGLITFYRGKYRREGMSCEWVQQGKSIADISVINGFVVRGEHIVAKSLKEAREISKEKREKQLAKLLQARMTHQKFIKDGEAQITFSDSITAGNCYPGTREFCEKYFAEIGKRVKSISVKDLRIYAKKFGVSYYAERIIRSKQIL